jgi:hypothetical protein
MRILKAASTCPISCSIARWSLRRFSIN